MTALFIVLGAIAFLICGYIFYGSWLARQWGIDPKRNTPASEKEDGVDYVSAKPAVLMGHHFSSIAGAGPINGPILASVFGWVPVFLWCVFGGIFIGGLQDFGSLFASIRNDGKSIGEIVKKSMGKLSKKLFIVFALFVLILLIASLVNVVSETFFTAAPPAPLPVEQIIDGKVMIVEQEAPSAPIGFVLNPTGNQSTAMISVCFIGLAICYGILTNRFGLKTLPATIIGIVAIVGIIILGLNVGLALNRTGWIVVIGFYTVIASMVPVWILPQPRDYLSSFLLYTMMVVAVAGIVFAAIAGGDRGVRFDLPAFTGLQAQTGFIFPTLFITIACGACSGFHALVASGTTSKQLDSERNAKLIGFGSMLVESILGVISLISVGIIAGSIKDQSFLTQNADGLWGFNGSPATAFGTGIAYMFGDKSSTIFKSVSALIALAVSVFALTTLDSATRLSRFMFKELFLEEGEESWKDAAGLRKILASPLFGSGLVVLICCIIGGLKLSAIWLLFGSANQLLAGLVIMAIAAWFGQIGKNNKMFIFPMLFMLIASFSYLLVTVITKLSAIISAVPGASEWGNFVQMFFSFAMAVFSVFLMIEGVKTFSKQMKSKKSSE